MYIPALNGNGISDSSQDPSAGAFAGILMIQSLRSVSDWAYLPTGKVGTSEKKGVFCVLKRVFCRTDVLINQLKRTLTGAAPN